MAAALHRKRHHPGSSALTIMLARYFIAVFVLTGSLFGGTEADWLWRPFEPVKRPAIPQPPDLGEKRNVTPIDAFIAAAQVRRGLHFRAEVSKETLLRRVYFDLIGLAPTADERARFLADPSPDAYEKVVDRLLDDPRHAERWARHWMDVWRYSDWAGWTDGKQIRDSQPHIWRWRDWIVESLAADVGYDRMIVDMLAADERAPEDASALRATGFLVRNYKMLSREQWLEDTVKHTSLAFLGLTVGCAKCHDHKSDPISQSDYYALRAVFEPHQVRLDNIPGQADTTQDGLARAFDADLAVPTYLFARGDERNPDKSHPIPPGVPGFLGGGLAITPVSLPPAAATPLRREFVRRDLEAAAEKTLRVAKEDAPVAAARLRALRAVLAVERLEEAGKKNMPEGEEACRKALAAQREEKREAALRKVIAATIARAEAALKGASGAEAAAKALADARQALSTAQAACGEPLTANFTPRAMPAYPTQSSGRRLAFANWMTRPEHPLTARVAVNHVWARHFGAGLVPSVADFGNGGRAPAHPALLDWLAADFVEHGWSFKHLHRLICLSAVYRQSSQTGESAPSNPQSADPDNLMLWRFPSRRLEAEAVRDNVLFLTGGLDFTRGGAEIDQALALTSPRRSLYFRCAAEKQPEILQVFDGPSVVECYERKPTVIPQQALALLNSELTISRARAAAAQWSAEKDDTTVVRDAFVHFLTREPQPDELSACVEFLRSSLPHARETFFLTLLNHHEFLTLR
jgi:hypothetical protein